MEHAGLVGPLMSKGNRSSLVAVQTPAVQGVVVKCHMLDLETERMMGLVRKVGRRLRHWMVTMPETRAAMYYDRENFCHHPLLDENGKQLTEPLIPDKDWLETADWYQKSMLGLLKEQRERAKMADGKGGLPIDDATFEAELAELAKQAVREMSTEELQRLLAERTVVHAAVVEQVDTQPVVGREPSEGTPTDAGSNPAGDTFPGFWDEDDGKV